jgi:hypothetical protein
MPSLQAFALAELGAVLHLADRADEARAAMSEAIAIFEAKGDIVSGARRNCSRRCG